MLTKAFSVYDSKAHSFGVPFFMPSVGAAVRAFSDLAQDVNSMVNRHPGDFVLYEIGGFEDSKGVLNPISPHVHLGVGSDFVSAKPISQYRNSDPVEAFVKRAVADPLATTEEIKNGK